MQIVLGEVRPPTWKSMSRPHTKYKKARKSHSFNDHSTILGNSLETFLYLYFRLNSLDPGFQFWGFKQGYLDWGFQAGSIYSPKSIHLTVHRQVRVRQQCPTTLRVLFSIKLLESEPPPHYYWRCSCSNLQYFPTWITHFVHLKNACETWYLGPVGSQCWQVCNTKKPWIFFPDMILNHIVMSHDFCLF